MSDYPTIVPVPDDSRETSDDDAGAIALSLAEDADRFILAFEDGFDYEPQHEWPAVAGALADTLIEYRDKPAVDLAVVRRDERQRLADLFVNEADTLRTVAPDGLTPELVAFMLKLDHG